MNTEPTKPDLLNRIKAEASGGGVAKRRQDRDNQNSLCADDVRHSMPLFRSGRGGSQPTSALQLRIREIGMRRAQELNRLWHSVLPETHLGNLVGNRHNVAYVAEYAEVAYAVAIWTTPIAANRMANGWNALELRRLAIADDAPKYTASRMISVMTRLIKAKWPSLEKLVSYQAEKHHKGTIYKAAGWKPTGRSDAKDWGRPGDRSRAAFQTDSAKVRWEFALPGSNKIAHSAEKSCHCQKKK